MDDHISLGRVLFLLLITIMSSALFAVVMVGAVLLFGG